MIRKFFAAVLAFSMVFGFQFQLGRASAYAQTEDFKVANLGDIMRDTGDWQMISMLPSSSLTPDLFQVAFALPQQEVDGTGSWASHLDYNKPVPKDTAWAFDMQINTMGSNAQFGFKPRTTALGGDTYVPRMYVVRYSTGSGGQLEIRRSNANWTETVLARVPNNGILKVNTKQEYVVGALDAEGGVRLILEVDGATIFDIVDTGAVYAPVDGANAGFPAITDQSQGFEFYFQGLSGQTGGVANNARITPADVSKYPLSGQGGGGDTPQPYTVTNVSALMTADTIGNWAPNPASRDTVETGVGSVKFNPNGNPSGPNWSNSFSYGQILPKNTVWAFRGKYSAMPSNSWIGFQLRGQAPYVDNSSTSNYFFRLNNANQWQCERADRGTEYNVVNNVPNTFSRPGAVQNYEVGTLDVDGGVRLILRIDGVTVFDVVDTGAYTDKNNAPVTIAPLDSDGYMTVNMYFSSAGNNFVMYPASGGILSVTVSPGDGTSVDVGQTRTFTADVAAADGYAAGGAVIWTLTGNTSPDTVISRDGALTVGPDEKSGAITLTATSADDSFISDSVKVIIPSNFSYAPSELYVSPSGSDGASGTIDSPLRTLQAAKDRISGYIAGASVPTGGITVYLRAGTYVLSQSLNFTAADSGAAGKPITYRAYNGEQVSFSGAETIPGGAFVPVTDPAILARLYPKAAGQVRQADLNALGIPRSRWGSIWRANPNTLDDPDSASLYVNGVRQTLARWPNQDYAATGKITAGQSGSKGATFEYSTDPLMPEAADRWAQADQAWASGYWYWDWFNDSMPISANTTDRTLTLGSGSEFGVAAGKRYYVFNLLEEIDMPGEWFLDRDTGILYYYPAVSGLAGCDVELAALEKNMIQINGANHLSFIGLTFENTSAAAFNIKNADGVLVAGCTFRNLGGKVADVTGTTNSGFTGNDAYDLSKGGIYMDSCGDKPALKPCNNYVTNNYFSRFNMASKTYTPAVSLKSGTVGARVANNVIHDGPHSGLLIAGVNNVYANNELYDLCSESDDAGAIYGGRNWTDANLTFTNNLLHDINGMAGKNSAYGIYFDDNMGSENVTGNIFYNVRTPVFGHGSWGNLIDGNVFANCGTPVSIVNYNWNQSNQDGMVASYDAIGKDNPAWNAAFPWWSKIGGAIDALSPRGVGQSAYLNSARDNVVTNNVSYASGAFNIASSALPTITMQNNVILPDAGYFTDAAANDYSLARIPSGLGADFVSPDYGAVGMYTDEYRSKVFVMNDFNLDYPFDGAANVQAYRLNLMWDRAVGATYYNVTVATDPGMSNVVFRGTAKGSFIEADGLDYGGKTYYWKVEAIGTSAKNPITKPDGNGVFSFTTAMSETADTSLLAAQISVGENYLNGVLVGVNPGEYTQAAYDVFAQTIADAKALMTLPGIVQAQADAMVQALKDGMKTLEASRITGLVDLRTLMRNASDWKTSSGAQFGLVPGESIAFKGSHLGYEAAVLPNYAIWSFRMQLGQPGDSWGGSWFAISLRNSNTIGDPWGATDYLFGFKQDVFELQKFGGASSLGNYQVPNNGIFELGKLYDIQYGVLDTPTGTHIIVKVDGRTIYDYYDNYNETANSNIPASGYIGFHFYGGLNRLQLQLYGAPEVQTDKSALEAGLTEAKGIIDGQAGKYTADSLAALESAIGAAQAVYDDSGADQSAVDEQAALLRQAIAGLAEAKLTCDVKSMLAKIAKPQKIPYTWTGVGMPAFTSSNAAVCGVTPDGTLTPLKAGIAVITITALNGEKVVFAVTVTA